jgi:hypothetical protein
MRALMNNRFCIVSLLLGAVIVFSHASAVSVKDDATRALRERASQLWEARVDHDWAAVYHLLPGEERSKFSEESFTSFREKKGPLHIVSAELGEIAVAADMGWVEVTYKARFVPQPQVPLSEVTIWDIWQETNGHWHPLPKSQRPYVPSRPPNHRPAAEEASLSKRVNEFWSAKETQDWGRLYQYLEPDYQKSVTKQTFLQRKAMFSYLTHSLEWAEVSGNEGKVKIVYSRKFNDPSVAKMAPEEQTAIERWIKVDGQWYRRISG